MSVKLTKNGRMFILEWAEFEERFLNRSRLELDFNVFDIRLPKSTTTPVHGKTYSVDRSQALVIGGI